MPAEETIDPQRLRDLLPSRPEVSMTALAASPVQIDTYADYGPAELDVPPLDHHFLLLQVEGTTRFTQLRSGKVFESEWRPGDLSLMPAGQASQWAWNSPTGTLQLYLPPALIRQVLEDGAGLDPAKLELMDHFRFEDPLLRHLGLALRAEMLRPGLWGAAYVDALTNALVLHLFARHSAFGAPLETLTERHLPADRMRRVRDLIEDNLVVRRSPTLSEMAKSAGYSVHHFVRLFKATTGIPPHRFFQERRLARARTMLLDGRRSIKEVADACGFFDQGHFARAFKARYGAPPSAVRARLGKIVQD